jgi:hypothetical protein
MKAMSFYMAPRIMVLSIHTCREQSEQRWMVFFLTQLGTFVRNDLHRRGSLKTSIGINEGDNEGVRGRNLTSKSTGLRRPAMAGPTAIPSALALTKAAEALVSCFIGTWSEI